MKGTNLGELEELVMLVIANMANGSYGLGIRDYIEKHCDRKVSVSTVHATLHRLEQKGYVRSSYDDSVASERGGRPRLIFTLTGKGQDILQRVRELRNQLWSTIPKMKFGTEHS